jgi:hypothetical protein
MSHAVVVGVSGGGRRKDSGRSGGEAESRDSEQLRLQAAHSAVRTATISYASLAVVYLHSSNL